MCCGSKGNPAPRWIVLDSCKPLSLGKVLAPDDHVIVNFGRLGHYQVDYSNSTLLPLLEIASEKNSPVGVHDIVGMMTDAHIFSMSHPEKIRTFLRLCKALGVVFHRVQDMCIYLLMSIPRI